LSILSLCTELVGTDRIIGPDPVEEICRNVVFRPFNPDLWLADPHWGIYFTDGRVVEAAAYRRLARRDRVGQSETIGPIAGPLPRSDAAYIYGGPVIPHYGHFLTAALPRFWHIIRDGLPKVPILCHAIERPEEWFARPYVATILGRLGLTPSHFIHFREPILLRHLRVPRPAFEEQHFAHTVFREMGERIGAPFSENVKDSGPVYVSKTRLGSGSTYRIMNEQPIEAAFAAAGIAVIFPELMSVGEQIARLSAASTIVGTVGSAFHTTIFCGRPKRIIGLAYDKAVNANYALIDKLVGNTVLYVHAPEAIVAAPTDGVTFGHRAEDVESVAKALLALV
jgi:capsular polysaccharide biosynthesis protein